MYSLFFLFIFYLLHAGRHTIKNVLSHTRKNFLSLSDISTKRKAKLDELLVKTCLADPIKEELICANSSHYSVSMTVFTAGN